ncbi:hypothetical protein [Paenarthrobacter ureafaciens]|uniref:hypothetical protein n=1 Tax=Paenarthrobacter ureafaciens TaxID=37931 RepID=UPI00190D3001|nr:hypothetical protein [Paenarthrobacter ureafaciens]GLU65811.1 hypothetical protein Pure02_40610 [Paenarthrobacter ureafaciens]GLU70112.1 hypothetical protein Pure03_40880 [Paenarthrobacter ureafaciens]GLU74370.1 hypothetical protein Pure04_40850 [Paenarthrobacter ureafaciens]
MKLTRLTGLVIAERPVDAYSLTPWVALGVGFGGRLGTAVRLKRAGGSAWF